MHQECKIFWTSSFTIWTSQYFLHAIGSYKKYLFSHLRHRSVDSRSSIFHKFQVSVLGHQASSQNWLWLGVKVNDSKALCGVTTKVYDRLSHVALCWFLRFLVYFAAQVLSAHMVDAETVQDLSIKYDFPVLVADLQVGTMYIIRGYSIWNPWGLLYGRGCVG